MKEGEQAGTAVVTDRMIKAMRATKPWTRFLASVGFALFVIMVLAGSVVTYFSYMFPTETGVRPAVAGPLFILLSLLCFFPALYLFRYASSVGDFLKSGASLDMERALSHQQSFWRIVGISSLTVLVLAALVTAAFFLLPVVAGR